METIPEGFVWWITAVEIPVISALFWLVWRGRRESDAAVDHLHTLLDQRCSQLRDALSAFKLEVAKTYASRTDMRALESRLVEHLLRIESKLDKTALQAAEMSGYKNKS